MADKPPGPKSPAKKMRLKPGISAVHVPEGLTDTLGMPEGVAHVDSTMSADFVLDFAENQAHAEERLPELKPRISVTTVA